MRSATPRLPLSPSKADWRAYWWNIQLSGTLSPSIAHYHINLLKLWDSHLALQQLRKHLKDGNLVKCNSMSIVIHYQQFVWVRSRSLCLQTWRQRMPSPPRRSSIVGMPRIRGSSVEWHLELLVCRIHFNCLQRPLIDLSARLQNHQLTK